MPLDDAVRTDGQLPHGLCLWLVVVRTKTYHVTGRPVTCVRRAGGLPVFTFYWEGSDLANIIYCQYCEIVRTLPFSSIFRVRHMILTHDYISTLSLIIIISIYFIYIKKKTVKEVSWSEVLVRKGREYGNNVIFCFPRKHSSILFKKSSSIREPRSTVSLRAAFVTFYDDTALCAFFDLFLLAVLILPPPLDCYPAICQDF